MIGHIKNEHRMSRNYFAHQQGDAINAILAAAGYNLYGDFLVKRAFSNCVLLCMRYVLATETVRGELAMSARGNRAAYLYAVGHQVQTMMQ